MAFTGSIKFDARLVCNAVHRFSYELGTKLRTSTKLAESWPEVTTMDRIWIKKLDWASWLDRRSSLPRCGDDMSSSSTKTPLRAFGGQ